MKNFFVPCFIFLILLSTFVFATTPKRIVSAEEVCCKKYYQSDFAFFQIGPPVETRRLPGDGFIVGQRKSNEGPKIINLNSFSECCNHVSDKNACLSCIATETERIEKQKLLKKTLFVGATVLAIILILLIILFSVLKIKREGKEFYGLRWSKIILMLLTIGIPGFFMLSFVTGGQTLGTSFLSLSLYVLFILLFWPFLVMLGFEKVLFGYVDWIHQIDVPFIIVAFVANVIYVYLLASLIKSIFRRC